MNAAHQSELFAALADLAIRYPEWRLGQLLANVAGWADQDVWNVEDAQLLKAARMHLDELVNRTNEVRAS